MRALSLVGGLLAAGSLLAVLTAVPALSASADTPSPVATAPGAPGALASGCDSAETPAAQLMCREPKLAEAVAALDAALTALGSTTDDTGRAAIDDAQTVWRARRDEACQVTAADLADAKATRIRSDCLLRVIRQRTTALEAERQARARPVEDLPLSVTGAAARRFAAPEPQAAPFDRKVALSTLAGRWAKADPNDRTAIDDCRTSYLEIGANRVLTAVDPRVPQFPLAGRLAAEGDPVQKVAIQPVQPEGALEEPPAPLATLQLLPADTARFDRLILRMAPPSTFAAEFVRCR
ncbi:DUF1311 domain-containing protein [Azospirillum sp. 412522]|nr:lysozyme inhibitor LprI family protein [Azospirillum sp. 412522]MBY6263302.1 DUF1311 domain-containing protein [Azospirillum sp. 412522]